MCSVVQLCLAANNILLIRKRNHAFLLLAISLAWKWQILIKKEIRWPNDKTLIELGYRKILWFVCVWKINYLPQPLASTNNWSRHRQIMIFCSTSSSNCQLFYHIRKWVVFIVYAILSLVNVLKCTPMELCLTGFMSVPAHLFQVIELSESVNLTLLI